MNRYIQCKIEYHDAGSDRAEILILKTSLKNVHHSCELCLINDTGDHTYL